MIKNCDHS